MVFETIIIGFVCILIAIIAATGGVIGISTYKSIALGLAEIGEVGKNTRERINVRADLAFGSDLDGDAAESDGGGSELDGIARMLGYESVGAALTDPSLLGKLGLGGSSKPPVKED